MNDLQHKLCEVAKMFTSSPSILLVEDDAYIVTYMRRVLTPFDVKFENAYDRATLEACVHDSHFNMLILDLVIPEISRQDLLRLVAEKTECPVMVFSGNIDSQIQQAAISILNRPIWFVDKPALFSPESFEKVFRMFNLGAAVHR